MLRFTNQPIPKEKPVVSFEQALDMTAVILQGMSYPVFRDFVSVSAFPMYDWLKIMCISKDTVDRIRDKNKRFSKLHTEKILQLASLNRIAKMAKGSKQEFRVWMDGDNRYLGKPVPRRRLLHSSFGIYFLMEELKRESGII